MTPRFHWSLPIGGDSRHLVAGAVGGVSARGDRPATLDYLGQITRAVEQLGFAGVAVADHTEDAWLTSAMLAGTVRQLTFLVPLRPDEISPALAARMAATFQRHTGGRLLIQLDGHADNIEEFLRVLQEPLYLTGPLEFAHHADVHLAGSEPPPAIAELVRRAADRPLRFGVRLHVITRDTSGQAWAEARRLLAYGQRMSELEVYPNLLRGIGLADLTLVGNHAEVADRIEEYHTLGVDEFVLSGHPHLEEAYWFGEGVLPILRRVSVDGALLGAR